MTSILIRLAIIVGAVLAIVALIAWPALAHDGHGVRHPVVCDDVEVPAGYDCHDPNGYGFPLPQDLRDHHYDHPVCVIVDDEVGSAAGAPTFLECLPETGVATGLLAVTGLLILGVGAALLAMASIDRAGTSSADRPRLPA